MSTEFIPFPNKARRFFLRGDFPFELCFSDFAQSRAARRAIQAAHLCDEPMESPIFEYDDDLVRLYKEPRFFVYCVAVMQRSDRLVALVGDGQVWMPAGFKLGLFADLLNRTKRYREKGSPEQSNPIVAIVPDRNPTYWLFPKYVALHDTAVSSAAVVEYETAKNYLAMNRTLQS